MSEDAEEYLEGLESVASDLPRDYVFKDVELPDSIAGAVATDDRFEIVDVEKGEFGIDEGTMIVDFRVR